MTCVGQADHGTEQAAHGIEQAVIIKTVHSIGLSSYVVAFR